ncbi:MAG: class I SAM-dependent methyltransferase [Planctomycetota bacterium]|nr:class I SAM-dependent methyltransferase [Planctomycetota bacterium]
MSVKTVIGKLDKAALGGALARAFASQRVKKSLKHQASRISYGFDVQYQKNDSSVLNVLADTYGSDKGEVSADSNPYNWPSHNYADFYSLVFGLRRNDVETVIECGLGTNNAALESSMGVDGKPGASLRMWRDYFPNANIVGCDIDSDILFSEERIKTFCCDQTSTESIHAFLKDAEIDPGSVDVIIDDGLHEYSAGICFFENMIGCLRADGIYIIEDVNHSDVMKYKDYFCENSVSFEARFVCLKSPYRNWGDDNNLICVTRKQMA